MTALLLLSLVGAVAPAAFMLHFVYVRDKYDREPLGLVLRVYFISFLTVIPAIILELIGAAALEATGVGPALSAALLAFLVVGGAEEGSKFLFLRWLAFHRKEFDEVYDGVLYAVAVGLGFATVENIGYVFSAPDIGGRVGVIIVRALLSVPVHGLLGVIMGYYIGRAKFTTDRGQRRRLLLLGFVVPAALHGLYDFPLLGAEAVETPTIGALFGLTVLLTVGAMWVAGVRLIHRAQEHSPFKRPSPMLHPLAALVPGYQFCTQCGLRAPVANRFCRACGAPFRPRAAEDGHGVGG